MNTQTPPYSAINFTEKFALFHEQWTQKVVAEMNDYQFKLARLEGEFIWHRHADTDETFIVLEGELVIEFRDGEVTVGAGEMYVVEERGRAQTQRGAGNEAAIDRAEGCVEYRR
jgi:mannose-6-phosphate isomerase-like protein (cupin superfamily)